jgi:hypothetical protein
LEEEEECVACFKLALMGWEFDEEGEEREVGKAEVFAEKGDGREASGGGKEEDVVVEEGREDGGARGGEGEGEGVRVGWCSGASVNTQFFGLSKLRGRMTTAPQWLAMWASTLAFVLSNVRACSALIIEASKNTFSVH